MKFLVSFDKSIGLSPIQKQLSPTDTIEDLEIHISLSFEQMHKCKLIHKGKALKNKSAKLVSVFDPSNQQTNQVTVTYLSEFESFTKDSSQGSDKYAEIAKKNPIAVVAIVVLVLIALMVSFA